MGVELNPGPRGRPHRNRNSRRRSRRDIGNAFNEAQGIIRSPHTLFPPAVQLRQTYTESFNLTLTSGVYANRVFRMNSTFDPDFTGVGGQPYGRDQIAAIYTRYRVDRFIWDVTMSCEAVGLGLCASVATCPASTTNTFGVIQPMSDMPWGKAGIATAYQPWHSRGSLLMREFLGQSLDQFRGDDSNESLTSTNPAIIAAFHVGAQNNAGNTQTVTVVCKFTYVVTYFIPLTMPAS